MSDPIQSSKALNSTGATFGDEQTMQFDSDQIDSCDSSQKQDGDNILGKSNELGTPEQVLEPVREESATPLISQLLNRLPGSFDSQMLEDPNFTEFLDFHNKVDILFHKDRTGVEGGSVEKPNDLLGALPKYNWEILSYAFEYVYKLYNDEINAILVEFDRLDVKRSIWQESAFRIDAERASKKLKHMERWISNEETHLDKTRTELSSSIQSIRNTLEKLNNPSSS